MTSELAGLWPLLHENPNANLQDADLRLADLTDAILMDIDLQGAILKRTVLHRANLRASASSSANPV